MVYQVRIKSSVLKTLKKLDTMARGKLWLAISGLAEQPRPHGCRKITGASGLWRIRVGDFRVIYQIRESELVVLVVKVGHRREVYR